jgi:hypothetical protein
MLVQQETDRNYGLFKGTVWSNLDLISTLCFVMKERISLSISTIGLIVYGRECPHAKPRALIEVDEKDIN